MKLFAVISLLFITAFVQLAPQCSTKNVKENLPVSTRSDDSIILIDFRRTSCYGYCPTYRITVYKSGVAVYEGISNVERIGTYHAGISPALIRKIKAKAAAIRFFDMADEYPSDKTMHVSDTPSVIIYLDFDGKQKKITDSYLPPPELADFEKWLDDLFKNLQWKPVKGSN